MLISAGGGEGNGLGSVACGFELFELLYFRIYLNFVHIVFERYAYCIQNWTEL